MEQKPLKQVVDTFIVMNRKGIHARPSTELARMASVFKSDITLHYREMEADAKSLVAVLMLKMGYGHEVTVKAVGVDAEEAVRSIVQLAKESFWTKF